MRKATFRVRRYWRRHSRSIAKLAGAFLLLSFAALSLGIWWMGRGLPDKEEIEAYRSPQTTKVYARDGQLVATLYEQNRTPVSLTEVAPSMRKAIVAIEDSRFYKHNGVDAFGVARALWTNMTAMDVEQGASTITMQLARNRFLSNERSLNRKVREAILAQRMESIFSKDEILELYLNQIYFGAGAYGIDSAASVYFAKNASQLSLGESALLAGLVQAPAHLNPFSNPEGAKRRQKQVLERMLHLGKISEKEHRLALDESAEMRFTQTSAKNESRGMLKAPYFTTYAVREASRVVPESDLYRQGLSIYTTLDLNLQREAESIVSNAIAGGGRGYGVDNAALVLLDNDTGAIRAMVGGTGWSKDNQFNRAWQAARQAGSSFKPFVYAEALENGYSPNSIVSDQPLKSLSGWQPQNYDHQYKGLMTLTDALRLSRNVVAVDLITRIGPQNVTALAHRMGLEGELPAYPSLALGSGEVTPLEMARAYAAFAREGETVPVHAIKQVHYPVGETRTPALPSVTRALSKQTAQRMIGMMQTVVESGTGTAARVPGYQVAGKTGTTDRYRDAWFVGFTPRYTLAVWVGNDDRSPTQGVSGGSLPAQIFSQVMAAAERGQTPLAFNLPQDGLEFAAHPVQTTTDPIRVYNYRDSGGDVTVLTNRPLEYEAASAYNYESNDYSIDESISYDNEGWRYYEVR